ncbi:MAG: methylated-DNA--[protein]-cysteine S-methyltransferase [Planctomycetaceae bacterium]
MAKKTLRSMRAGESYPGVREERHVCLETRAGPVQVTAAGDHVVAIRLGGRAPRTPGRDALLGEALEQLRAYFAGRRTSFDLPLRLEVPRFTGAVLRALDGIPFGSTTSYGRLASLVSRPRAARAVGQSLGANPLPIVIPCHRVLAGDGSLGGFGGGLPWKRFLLRLEGIEPATASRA